MKYLFLVLSLSITTNLFAQVKITVGNNNNMPFTLPKQPVFTSFNTDNTDYFILKRTENFERINTMVVADKAGNIISTKDLRPNPGVFNNVYDVKNFLVVGNKPVLFVEHRDKQTLKNTFETYLVDNSGNIAAAGIPIGSIDVTKMASPGDWYAALTPDKKHVAVIGKLPHVKDVADVFKYFILDDNLKEVSKGQFSFAGNNKLINVSDFLASDKGDLYIISEELDKSYKLPILYKFTEGAQPIIIPIMMADPDLRNLTYKASINPAGDLVIGGYLQKKKTFEMNDPESTGTYLFNSSKPNEVKTFMFAKPITNLTARNIIYNGDTFFLIGEQYKAEKQRFTGSALSPNALTSLYDYTHNDIMITAFAPDFTKKFEMPISRKWAPVHVFDSDFMLASGIVNNKLMLIYNDQYGKYVDDQNLKNAKLPVAVTITNDGLMETPTSFEKDLHGKLSGYTLYPQFFSVSNNRLILLSGNGQSVRTNIFQ